MMTRTVLFAGGPLHGTTETFADGITFVYATDPPLIAPLSLYAAGFGSLDCPPTPRTVRYAVSGRAMCGRIVWIGHLDAEPDEDLVFEVLASDGAKMASVLEPKVA